MRNYQAILVFLLASVGHMIQPSFGATTIYQDCKDESSLCYGLPENCIASSNCHIVFRSQFDAKTGFHLELTAPSIAADKYIAVGFSNSTVMSGLVVYCSQKSGQGVIGLAFNKYNEHENTPIANQKDVSGFTKLESSVVNGQLQCKWQVEPSAKVQYNGNEYDFEQGKFFVQLATGPFDPVQNKINFHDAKLSSQSSSSLKRTSSTTPTTTPKPNGSLMTAQWNVSLMIFGLVGCMMTKAILMAQF